MDAEFAEAQRERLLVGVRHVLIAKQDHLVAIQCVLDLPELFVGQRADTDATDLRSHCRVAATR